MPGQRWVCAELGWLSYPLARLVGIAAFAAGCGAVTPSREPTPPSGSAIMSLDVKGGCYRQLDCNAEGSSLVAVVSASHATVAPLHIGVRWGTDQLGNPEKLDDAHPLGPKPETIRISSRAPCKVLIELILEAKTQDNEFYAQRVTKKCTDDF